MAPDEGRQRCLYEILGVDVTAPAEEIRLAYRKLALKFDRDKAVQNGVSHEEATRQFQETLGAFKVLSDPEQRSRYE